MRNVPPRSVLAITAVFAVALVVRLAWAWWTAPAPPEFSDAQYYDASARGLANGDGYRVAFGETGFDNGGAATAFWPPGYPMYLAAGLCRVRRRSHRGADGQRGRGGAGHRAGLFHRAQAVRRSSRTRRRRHRCAATQLCVLTPVLLSETLFTLLFAAATAFVLYSRRGDGKLSTAHVVAASVMIALGALVRGQALVLIPMAVVWWLASGVPTRTALAYGAGSAVITAAVLAPWAVRNASVMDSPILLSANAGYNLRIGHAPYSTGRYIVPQDLWDAEPGISFQEREVLFNDLGAERAIDYAGGNPGREVELAGRKIMWLWRPDSDALFWASSFGATPLPEEAHEPLRLALDVSYLSVLALAGLGAMLSPSVRRGLLLPLLLIAAWTALHVVFFGEPRYHLPMLTIIVPMAAAALVTAYRRVASVRRA